MATHNNFAVWSWIGLEALETSPVLFFCCAGQVAYKKGQETCTRPSCAFILASRIKKHIREREVTRAARCWIFLDWNWMCWLWHSLTTVWVLFSNGKNIECRLTAQIPCHAQTHLTISHMHSLERFVCFDREALARLVHAAQGIVDGVTAMQRSGVRPQGDNYYVQQQRAHPRGVRVLARAEWKPLSAAAMYWPHKILWFLICHTEMLGNCTMKRERCWQWVRDEKPHKNHLSTSKGQKGALDMHLGHAALIMI